MSRYGGFRVGKYRILTEWDSRKSPSSNIAAPASITEFEYSTAQGIWNLNSTVQFPKQLPAVTFAGISGSKGEVSGNITLPTISSNQMIVFMERANSSTPPTLRNGFTNILTQSITSPAARSIRLQYRLGGSTETFSTASAACYIVLNNATTAGVFNSSGTTAAATTTILSPTLAGINTDGKSFIFTTSYFPSAITSTASPYTTVSGVGGYIQNPTTTTLAAANITHSTTAYTLSAAVEFRP
jgi:hypothetical protein